MVQNSFTINSIQIQWSSNLIITTNSNVTAFLEQLYELGTHFTLEN